MKMISFFRTALMVLFLFVYASCEISSILDDNEDDSSTKETQTESASDYLWDDDAEITEILFDNTSISVSSSNVTVSGTTITITAGGYYSLSGMLGNGQIIVDAKVAEVRIQLNGVTVSNASTSPFFIRKASKVIVFLAEGTTNTFTDASSYTNTDNPDACIFSTTYLAVTGTGRLNVTGSYQDGIASSDELIIDNGIITVTAVGDAIRGKDYLKVNGGTIIATSTSSGHALKSNNEESSDVGYVQINGGTMTLASANGKGVKTVNKYIQHNGTVTITKSTEGIESINITLNEGVLDVTASDDGLNATKNTKSGGTESNDGSSITVNGGMLVVSSTRGDAIDSNGNLTCNGGIIIANGPASGVEQAIDVNGSIYMNGGVLVAAGSKSNMNKAMSTASTQSNIYVTSGSTVSSSTLINLRIGDADVITFKPKNNAASFYFSCPEMSKGSSYTIHTGGSYSTTTNTGGYYTDGTYTPGTVKKTGTLSSSGTVNTFSM